MTKKRWSLLLAVVLVFVMAGTSLAGGAFVGDTVPRMEIDELMAKLDSPDIVIYDVRRAADFEGSELMIKNAERKAYNDVASWAGSVPRDKTVVLYCA